MNPRLCCIQVKKLNGGVILNPKRGKWKEKKKCKDSRVDPKEVYTSQGVDRFRFIESLLTNNHVRDSKESHSPVK